MTEAQTEFKGRRVLVVDDEAAMRTALEASFLRYGWGVATASGVQEAAGLLGAASFDLVVTDMRMRDGDGMQLLTRVREAAPGTAVILLTAYGSVPDAVESMRCGAIDYLTKPTAFDALLAAASRVMRQASVQARAEVRVAAPSTAKAGGPRIVGSSARLQQTLQRARAAAATDADVLVEAESGTGKELLARFIHESSPRRGRPFIAINCAAVPEHLIESELFGHAKGAFTGAAFAKAGKFELADGGTLLLDEIGEMPLNLQPKLLRVLQEREFERLGETRAVKVNFRVVATTNAGLAAMVEQGRFRSDLYYRLNVIPMSMPPLRERREDIAALARHFAECCAQERGLRAPELEAGFLARLEGHDWPGNIRELSNFMRRVVSLNEGMRIDAACFDREFMPLVKAAAWPPALQAPSSDARLAAVERRHLEHTLAITHGNRTHTAEMLGISLRTVRNKIKEYGLPPRRLA